jgi:hypothetical protein
MLVHVVDARYVDGYRIEVVFDDGRKGIADLSDAIQGPAFEALTDKSEFQRFVVDKELDTLVWENGADLAPEFIYYRALKDDSSLQEQFRSWGYIS